MTLQELYELSLTYDRMQDSETVIDTRHLITVLAMRAVPGHDYRKNDSGTWYDYTWQVDISLNRDRSQMLPSGVCSPAWWAQAMKDEKDTN